MSVGYNNRHLKRNYYLIHFYFFFHTFTNYRKKKEKTKAYTEVAEQHKLCRFFLLFWFLGFLFLGQRCLSHATKNKQTHGLSLIGCTFYWSFKISLTNHQIVVRNFWSLISSHPRTFPQTCMSKIFKRWGYWLLSIWNSSTRFETLNHL